MGTPADINIAKATERVVRNLQKLERPDGTIPSERMEKFQRLARDLAELSDAGVTLNQRSRMPDGALAYHSNFTRMRDVYLLLRLETLSPGTGIVPIPEAVRTALKRFFTLPEGIAPALPALRLNGELMAREIGKIRAKLWNELPHSTFKLFQEIYSTWSNFTVPVKSYDRNTLNTCHLTACQVSPDLIPNKFLSDAGLVTWSDPTPSRMEALRVKSDPAIIDGVKAFWESLAPLESSNSHIKVVRQHSQRVRSRYPGIEPIKDEAIGSLMYTREKISGSTREAREAAARGEFKPRQVTASFFSSPYGLLRKTVEEELGYNVEGRQVQGLIERWQGLNREFNDSWRKGTPTADRVVLKRRLVALIDDSESMLKHSTNKQKEAALAKLAEIRAKYLEAPTNPDIVIDGVTPMLSKMVAAITRLKSRDTEIPFKARWNEYDRRLVRRCIDAHEAMFDALEAPMLGVTQVMRSNRGYFQRQGLTQVQREAAADSILTQLSLNLPHFNTISVRPFRAFAAKMLAIRNNLRNALVGQDIPATKDALVKMACIWRLDQMNHACELLRHQLIPGSGVSLTEIVDIADRMTRIVQARNVLPDHTAAEYVGPYGEVEKWVRDVLREIRSHARRGIRADTQTEIFSRIRSFLDTKDLEALARELPA
jgi:hypothetical protein